MMPQCEGMDLRMNARRGISLLCLLIGIFLVTSISYAWVNPKRYGTNQNLDLVLFDGSGKELPKDEYSNFRLFDEDNVYPGWEDSYTLQIKNKGSGPVDYTIGLSCKNPEQKPNLADVMVLIVTRSDRITFCRLSDINGKILQEATTLGAQETQTFDFTLLMDEEAGNEYQNLSLEVFLQIAAEQTSEQHEDPGQSSGGGGGGKRIPVTIDPDPKPEPEPEEVTKLDIPLPDRGEEDPEPDIEIEPTPFIEILPKTGGVPYQLLLAIGIVFIVIGCWLGKSKHIAD